MANTSKPELVLQHLDEWMIRWKHFQTEDDWKIELAAQKRRQTNYGITGAVFVGSYLYTMAPATVNRWFGAPHFFNIGVDVAIKDFIRTTVNGQRRYTPTGYGRIAFNFIVPFVTISLLEHRSEKKRLNDYVKVESTFGEQARRLVKTGHIEEFLAPNVGSRA
jgi:alpha-L-arabinofuranosidase